MVHDSFELPPEVRTTLGCLYNCEMCGICVAVEKKMRNSRATQSLAKGCYCLLELPESSLLVPYFFGFALSDSSHPRILTNGRKRKRK